MKRIISLLIITVILLGCTSNAQSHQVPATISATEMIPNSEKSTWNVYDPDPDHIWNRVFRQFYSRTATDGKEYGLDELDPLLWPDTTYLLNGASHEQAIHILDEFLS